jgi:tripartite-type tricarboxylate transporter receptor subunit TctC
VIIGAHLQSLPADIARAAGIDRAAGIARAAGMALVGVVTLASLLPVVAAIVSLDSTASARAQGYPSHPLVMLVGYAAGGGADALARITAAKLSPLLGQQVVVENRPGAGATLAAQALAKAAPDGYTLYFADSAILVAPSVYAHLGYDPRTSFSYVGGVCSIPLAIVAHPSAPFHSLGALIEQARAAPGKLSYGHPGVGTVQHLAMELFKRRAGVDILAVPYKGAAPILPDLIGGQIPLAVISAAPAIAQARAHKLITLAITTTAKLQSEPSWPTVAETLPGFDAAPRLFLLAPAGTPQPVVARLSEALKAALEAPDTTDSFTVQGATVEWSSPDGLAHTYAQELEKWAEVARTAGIKPE